MSQIWVRVVGLRSADAPLSGFSEAHDGPAWIDQAICVGHIRRERRRRALLLSLRSAKVPS